MCIKFYKEKKKEEKKKKVEKEIEKICLELQKGKKWWKEKYTYVIVQKRKTDIKKNMYKVSHRKKNENKRKKNDRKKEKNEYWII